MAAVQLLSIATTAANSADFTLTAGQSCTIGIKRTLGESLAIADGSAQLYRKDDAGVYNPTGIGVSGSNPNIVVSALGTFRMTRPVSAVAFGLVIDGPA